MRPWSRIALTWTVGVALLAFGDAATGMRGLRFPDHHVQVAIWGVGLSAVGMVSTGFALSAPRPEHPRRAFGAFAAFVAGLFLSLYNVVWEASRAALNVLVGTPRFAFPVRLYPFVWLNVGGVVWYGMVAAGAIVALGGAAYLGCLDGAFLRFGTVVFRERRG